MKKIFTLFAALTMVMSMFAAEEKVYFVNAHDWTGNITVHAWGGTATETKWPGVAATKEAEKISGKEVWSFTAEAGAYKNVIFTNKGDNGTQQTGDLVWTAGKYWVKDAWCTKFEAELKLGLPVTYETVYFVNVDGWDKVKIYTWAPEVAGWPGDDMKKEAEQLGGYDVYSYTVESTTFGGMLFNCGGDECKTGDLKWEAGKYFVKNEWYTKEEAAKKLEGGLTVSYYVVGTFNTWTNPDPAYVMAKDGDVYKKSLTLAAGEHMFKVTDGTWNQSWGYSDVSTGYEEITEGTNEKGEKNGNILLALSAEKTITVVFNAENKKITIEGLTEAEITYALMGVNGDWTTGIALEANPDNQNEHRLLGQTIKEGDAVKVVSMSNGAVREYFDNVDAYSVEHSKLENGNIVLAPGKYDFYFKVSEKTIFISASATSSVENVIVKGKAVKVMRNGQMCILRDGIYYNMLGLIAE